MSDFTRFSANERLAYSYEASQKYKKDLWECTPGVRYFVGSLDSNTWVDIESGFLTDGATIPRALWWLLPPLGEYTQATTLHDKLCNTYYVIELIDGVETKVPIDRKRIDSILEEALIVTNVTKWKRLVIMAGVNTYRTLRNPKTPKTLAESIA